MAITATLYNFARERAAKAGFDLSAGTKKVILLGAGGTLSNWNGAAGHKGYADVSSNEIATASGYTQNTKALSTIAFSYGTNRYRFTSDPVQWTASGGSIAADFAIIFDDAVTTPTADLLLLHIDFGGTETATTGGTFTITPDSTDGWFYF